MAGDAGGRLPMVFFQGAGGSRPGSFPQPSLFNRKLKHAVRTSPATLDRLKCGFDLAERRRILDPAEAFFEMLPPHSEILLALAGGRAQHTSFPTLWGQ